MSRCAWSGAYALLLASLFGCQSGAATGTPCARDGECASPAVCRLGRCRAQCSENRDCPPGAQCFLDPSGLGACQLAQDRSCGGGCPSGLTCLNDECVRACSVATECPTDGFCAMPTGASVGLCIDLRTTDGGRPDVGLQDAGPVDAAPSDMGLDTVQRDGGSDAGLPTLGHRTVCAGEGFSCAVRAADGAVFCWGDAGREAGTRLGDGAFDGTTTTVPTYGRCNPAGTGFDGPCATHAVRTQRLRPDMGATEPIVGATDVACGASGGCAIVAGEVLCWGLNYASQRGDTTLGDRPYAATTGLMADALFSGRDHFCSLRAGELTCWGVNTHGETVASASGAELPHVVVSGVLQAGLGGAVTCVARGTTSVECAGWNHSAQLGRTADIADFSATFVAIPVDGSRGIVAGTASVCALGASGQIACWGEGDRGMLGSGIVAERTTPAAVTGTYDAIVGGSRGDQVCGRRASDGRWLCWGDNNHGACLVAPTVTSAISNPTLAPALDGATSITFGFGSGVAELPSGIVAWGGNPLGQLANGTFDANAHPVPSAVGLP